jgi:hypothetical protein
MEIWDLDVVVRMTIELKFIFRVLDGLVRMVTWVVRMVLTMPHLLSLYFIY